MCVCIYIYVYIYIYIYIYIHIYERAYVLNQWAALGICTLIDFL